MRGRAILHFLFLSFVFVFVPVPAAAQCEFRQLFSGPFRASVSALSVDGDDLWAASGFGVQLYDRRANPPRLIASVALPGVTRVVRASNGVAWAGSSSGLYVIRRTGESLQLVRTIPGPAVNDLLLNGGRLFAATSAGLLEFDLADPLSPSQLNETFATTAPAVLSLAGFGSTLFAADGDATIEAFSVVTPQPQKLASIPSLSNSRTVSVAGSRLYVSDGQRTEIFPATGGSSFGVISTPMTSVVEIAQNVIAAAAGGRLLFAFDVTLPATPVELFQSELPPSAGTINRVSAVAVAGGALYAAGGDIGLATYDISRFASPFPLRMYGGAPATSIVVTGKAVYAANANGGIRELQRSGGNLLTERRTWATDRTHIVHDAAEDFLLTSSGGTLTWWTVVSLTPSAISNSTFQAPITAAALRGTKAVVLLSDATLWTVDLAQANPVPVRTGGGGSFLAVSNAGRAVAEVTPAGSTNIQFALGPEGSLAPVILATVPGVATALALSGSTAAVFTYRGITLIDFGSGTAAQTVLPRSNTAIVRDLDFAGSKLLDLTARAVRVWIPSAGTVAQQFSMASDAVAIDASPDGTFAAVATADGVASISIGGATDQPALASLSSGNSYYRKAAANSSSLFLFDGRSVEVFDTRYGASPAWVTSVQAAGVIDIAVSDAALFTLSGAGLLSEYSTSGVLLRSVALNEGADAVPLAVSAVWGVPWVSLSRGCVSTGCRKETIVFDPQSLARTATLEGAVVDVSAPVPDRAVNMPPLVSRAAAIFDSPAEIRVYRLDDPMHPVVLASASLSNGALSVATAGSAPPAFVLGERLYLYDDPAGSGVLTKTAEYLDPSSPPAGKIEQLSNCLVVAGRSPAAVAFSIGTNGLSPGGTMPFPGSIRSVASQPYAPGRLYLLTDYSLEIWSLATTTADPPRKRAIR